MFQVPSVINSVKTLVDGGNKLSITTRELKPDEMTKLFELKGNEGWLLFKGKPIKENDLEKIPDIPVDEFDKKSPSQRLRDRMYIYYKKTHNDVKDFRQWYANALDTLGQQYLDKIN